MTQFNPALLKVAREAKGWPQNKLAEESGIAQASISRYEKGLMTPSDDHVAAVSAALGVSSAFLTDGDAKPASVMYRSRSLRSLKQEATVRARLNLARMIAVRFMSDIEIQTETHFPGPDRIYESPEAAAQEVRQAWWLEAGPIGDLSRVIEAAGGVVLRADLGSDDVDAAYLHPLGDPIRWFVVNSRTTAGDRVRFSLAHELGHAILHEGSMLPDSKVAEDESNRFAGAFMISRREFEAELPRGRLKVAHLVELKRRWGMSMGALAMRAHQIGAIDRDELKGLWREIGWRGYRTVEPVDLPIEEPMIFSAVLDVQRQEHGLTDAALAELARVSPVTLSSIFPEHFSAPRVTHLRVISSRSAEEQQPGQHGAATVTDRIC
jgi:Zn-dependent peptidase ImmA (M78 family)/DNA-binding XRE family transcriptional regulator